MALPLNRYKTEFNTSLSAIETAVYTAPVGYNAVVLAVAACNTSTLQKSISIEYDREGGRSNLTKDFPIPGNDTADLTTGKLIVEQGDTLFATASDNTVHLTLSILETKI